MYSAACLEETVGVWIHDNVAEDRVPRLRAAVGRILIDPHNVEGARRVEGDWPRAYASVYVAPTGAGADLTYVVMEHPEPRQTVVFCAVWDLVTLKVYRNGGIEFFDPDDV